MDDDGSLSSGLLCQESKTCLDEYSTVLDEDEYVKTLCSKEISSGFKRVITDDDKSLVLSDESKCVRLEAISWILNTRAVFGFRFKTAYLSVTYLDRFLSKRSIDSDKLWAIKLLSVACVSLAAKMEEVRVPPLSELQKLDEYNFGSSVILRMELLVLTTLDWRMGSITPFAFLHYFITKFSNDSDSPRSEIVSRIIAIILAIMREINLMEYRPSAIAIAATLAAFDQRLTRKSLETYCGFLDIEDVFTCYNIMQKLEMKKLKSPDLSATDLRTTANVSPSGVSSERKRLTFNDSDQSSDRPNEKPKV